MMYDIAIIGCGLVGATLAKSLSDSGKHIVLIDAKTPEPLSEQKTRPISLSYGSQQILENLTLWQALAPHATPIKTVHVSEQGHFGVTKLHAEDVDVPALGYVVPLHQLYNALLGDLHNNQQIKLITPNAVVKTEYCRQGICLTLKSGDSLKARLVVAADGSQSLMRKLMGIEIDQQDSNEHAIVASLSATHQNIAYERFTSNGILALLPQQHNRCGMVWTSSDPNPLLNLSDETFLAKLQKTMGYRLGKFSQLTKRHSYKLQSFTAKEQVRPHFVLLGNAAHTLYPIAAQGFNLSLSDLNCLTTIIKGDRPLTEYQALRKTGQNKIALLTNSLATSFNSQNPAKVFARNLGLFLLDHCPPAKNAISQLAMGITH